MILLALSLYFSKKSLTPENAIWLIYLSISSSVIPIPRSLIVSVPSFSSRLTLTVRSPSSPLKSPFSASVFIFCEASTAFDTISRRKISWSEYKNFLMTGNMFSVVTPMLPFCISILFLFLLFSCLGYIAFKKPVGKRCAKKSYYCVFSYVFCHFVRQKAFVSPCFDYSLRYS